MKTKFKEIEDKLDQLIESGELDVYFEKKQKYNMIVHDRAEKVYQHIKDLSKDDLHTLFIDTLRWVEEFENMNGSQSNILNLIQVIFVEKGKKIKPNKINLEDFLVEAYKYRKYKLKIYCGQGCFIRIMYKKDILFQSN